MKTQSFHVRLSMNNCRWVTSATRSCPTAAIAQTRQYIANGMARAGFLAGMGKVAKD